MYLYFVIAFIAWTVYVAKKSRETKDTVDVVMSALFWGPAIALAWPIFVLVWLGGKLSDAKEKAELTNQLKK